MSLINGNKDVLVRSVRGGVLVDALSKRGFEWMRSHYETVRTVFHKGNSTQVGHLVSVMLANRLTIEVRSHEAA